MFPQKKVVNLKTVAARVGLAPCSVSAILNNTEAARAIPQSTKDRVYHAATELNYRPNHWARSLRTKQTRMVAVLADLGRHAVAQIVIAAQQILQRRGYLLVLISSGAEDGTRLNAHLQQRGIEGVLAVDTTAARQLSLPVVSVEVGFAASKHSSSAMDRWFVALGESAAEIIVQRIENPALDHRTKVEPILPPAFFAAPSLEFASKETIAGL